MRGKIYEYNRDTKSGLILSVYESTYRFDLEEYESDDEPVAGVEVDFITDGSAALEIYPVADKEPSVSVAPKSPKSSAWWMSIAALVGLGAILGVIIYSEIERRNIKEIQNDYHSQIKLIERYLEEKNCTQASMEYNSARKTRQIVDRMGLYYSIQPFAIQAHTIEIAECYFESDDYENALRILDAEDVRNGEYQRRMSELYKKMGEESKAGEAKLKADKFDLPDHKNPN